MRCLFCRWASILPRIIPTDVQNQDSLRVATAFAGVYNPNHTSINKDCQIMEVMPIAKKKPIVSVTFSYVGKASDFETFLKTIVRDYLAVDDPAAAPETDFVQKVESGVA